MKTFRLTRIQEDSLSKDPYIFGYRFIKGKLLSSEKVTITEFSEYMNENGFEDDALLKKIFKSAVIPGYISGDKESDHQLYRSHGKERVDNEFDMEAQPYFHLLEATELQDARKNAASARRFSRWAIVISLIALAISFYGVFFKIQEVSLDDQQLDIIVNQIKENRKE